MKKIFTLALALVAFSGASKAATVDDLEPLKHSYVLVCDELGARPGKGVLFGANHFLDVKGGTTATNKGTVDLSVAGGNDGYVTEEIAAKYGADYAGPHYNFLRLKNQQDMLALKLTAKSKIIIFEQGNNKEGTAARIPRISTDEAQSNSLNAAPDADHPSTVSGFRWEFTVDDDGTYYLGSYNGDMFISFIIIEANEAPGTPTVKVGDQTFEGGLWFREVSCKANDMVEEGSTEKIPTIVTYTTDGTAPNENSTLYTEPIKCYQNMTLKFQAYMDFGGDVPREDQICDGADNEANVSFSFDAPTIEADGASFTITTPYAEQNGSNFYSLNGEEAVKGDGTTLAESATISAYTEIANGTYATFTSKSTTKDVYVLNPIKEKKVITVNGGDVVLDEEATATSTTGEVYKFENGTISADKMDFFVKNLTFALVPEEYQIDGQQAYIQMSNTNITFLVAAGDSVKVKVTTSKNSCKTLNAEEDESVNTDRKNYVNVSGTNYGHDDVTEEGGNIIEFTLYGGKKTTTTDDEGNSTETFEGSDTYYTFQKYSGTGNILIASIEIAPAGEEIPVTPEPTDLIDKFTYCWNEAETITHNEDGSITYNAKHWGGVAAWLQSGDEPEDWSAYSQIVFEFAEATPCATQVFLQYNDGTETKAWVESGATMAAANLEAGKVAMKQAALQCAEDATLTITKIYLTEGENGIQNLTLVKAANNAIYNLAGQKVDANYRGVVVVNGKKMILK